MNESNAEFLYQHARQAQALEASGLPQLSAFTQSFEAIGHHIAAESTVLAFRDCFYVIAIWFVVILFALILMPKPKLQTGA